MTVSPAAEPATDNGASASLSRGHHKCGLIQCRRLECNLKSHRQFAAAKRQLFRSRVVADQPSSMARLLQQQPQIDVLEQTVLRVQRQMDTGFPGLQLKQQSLSIFRELAHHYFVTQMDRLIQNFSPHLDRNRYKMTMIEHAQINDVFCICITANAKTDMLMRGHIRIPDRASEIVYATTAQVLRRKLTSYKATEIDWLLVLVVALVGFDLAFRRDHALQGHHEALRHLVKLKGGIHAIGHTLPYILNTDRFLAIYNGAYPIVRKTPLLPQPCPSYDISDDYGAAFTTRQMAESIDPGVLDFCTDTCQLFELMEVFEISLKPKTVPASDASVLPYFLYQRDHLLCEGTCLYADYHEKQIIEGKQGRHRRSGIDRRRATMSRCVLLAVMIIEYYVAHGNYYTIKGPYLADQLQRLITHQRASEWTSHNDMLLWLLFVLVTIPEQWAGHAWAVDMLRHHLATKHTKLWPQQLRWVERQLALLKRFVWARSLENLYRKVCLELISNEK